MNIEDDNSIYDDNSTKEYLDISAISGTVIMFIIILGFIIAYLVFRFNTKTPTIHNTLFSRLDEFFGGSMGQFSIGMLVAILVSNVVSAFNGAIIEPIVKVSIPNQDIFNQQINLGRNVYMNPASFFLSLLSFFISLLILFFIIEGIFQLSKLPKMSIAIKYILLIIIITILIGIMSWNIYDIVNNKKIPEESSQNLLQNSINFTPIKISQNPMSTGMGMSATIIV